jgi:hypothetical protein
MFYRLFFWTPVFCVCLFCSQSYSSEPTILHQIEPQAKVILNRMTEFMDTLQQFTFHAENTEDRLLSSGQKIQFAWAVDMAIRRPNRFRAYVKGDEKDQQLFYNGRTITLWKPHLDYYGILAAPPSIEEALDFASESFELHAPLADFIRQDSFDPLPPVIYSAVYVGQQLVHGISCHHLAFRQDDLDWQIWIEDSETPLPRKVIITQKFVTGAPQFTALLLEWNLAPQLPDRHFTFSPPKNAKKIEFLPVAP